MKLRVNLPFGTYRKGDVIDPPALQAQRLLAQRYLGKPLVVRLDEAPPAAQGPQPPQPPAMQPQGQQLQGPQPPPRHRRKPQ